MRRAVKTDRGDTKSISRMRNTNRATTDVKRLPNCQIFDGKFNVASRNQAKVVKITQKCFKIDLIFLKRLKTASM